MIGHSPDSGPISWSYSISILRLPANGSTEVLYKRMPDLFPSWAEGGDQSFGLVDRPTSEEGFRQAQETVQGAAPPPTVTPGGGRSAAAARANAAQPLVIPEWAPPEMRAEIESMGDVSQEEVDAYMQYLTEQGATQ